MKSSLISLTVVYLLMAVVRIIRNMNIEESKEKTTETISDTKAIMGENIVLGIGLSVAISMFLMSFGYVYIIVKALQVNIVTYLSIVYLALDIVSLSMKTYGIKRNKTINIYYHLSSQTYSVFYFLLIFFILLKH
jgi:hypothetical protein